MTLAINKMDGDGLSNTAHHERSLQHTRHKHFKNSTLVTRPSTLIINMSGCMRCDPFKRRLDSGTVIISA